MINASSRRQIGAFAGGFASALLLVFGLLSFGVLPGRAAQAASTSSSAHINGYLPTDSHHFVSSIRYMAQYFWHDHKDATVRVHNAIGKGTLTAPGKSALFTAPGGAMSFNSDTSAFTQNEESFAIDPTTSSGGGQTGVIGVGGFNDFRGFFLYTTNTLSGYAVSKTVSCGAGVCAHLFKDGWLPGATDPLCKDGSILVPAGDPAIGVSANGTFYYASLAFPSATSACGNSNGDNGVIVAMSNSNLENPSVACNDALTTNNCWTSVVVHANSQSGCFSNPPIAPCAFDDKDWITVDPATGRPTFAWDYFDGVHNVQYVDAVTCGTHLGCGFGAPHKVSTPPSPGTDDTFAPYLATWHNPQKNANEAILTYEQINFGSRTVDQHIVDLTTPGTTVNSDTIFRSMPFAQFLQVMATDQYRILSQTKVAADARAISNPQIYVTYDQCQYVGSDGAGANYYYDFTGGGFGACAQSLIKVLDFSSPTTAGTSMGTPSGTNQTFPSVSVDEATGQVALSYYTTQDDTLEHATLRPYAAVSAGGSSAFSAVYSGLLSVSNDYTADPALAFVVGPANGDYLQVAMLHGDIYVHFNANFELKSGPPAAGTVPVNQEDNYLCYIQAGTAAGSGSACHSA